MASGRIDWDNCKLELGDFDVPDVTPGCYMTYSRQREAASGDNSLDFAKEGEGEMKSRLCENCSSGLRAGGRVEQREIQASTSRQIFQNGDRYRGTWLSSDGPFLRQTSAYSGSPRSPQRWYTSILRSKALGTHLVGAKFARLSSLQAATRSGSPRQTSSAHSRQECRSGADAPVFGRQFVVPNSQAFAVHPLLADRFGTNKSPKRQARGHSAIMMVRWGYLVFLLFADSCSRLCCVAVSCSR